MHIASDFETQLDFILFAEGLAFILLGALCLGIARGRLGQHQDLALIGVFGCLYGVFEWMNMVAVIAGDGAAFAIIRVAAMTLSFLCLAEFVRKRASAFRHWLPG